MGYSLKQMLDVLKDSRDGFGNSLNEESVLEKVRVFGFSKERIEKAMQLNQEAEDLFLKKGKKTGEKMSLYFQFEKVFNLCYETYINYRKILRRAFLSEPDTIIQLNLNTKVPPSIMGRLEKMKEFYQICQENEPLLNRVSGYGLSQEKIAEELQKITDIESEIMAKGMAKMEDEKATEDRNKKFRELSQEWGLYREILKIIYLKESSQFLEAFGIRVPTDGFYQRKKKNDNDEVPEEDTIPVDPVDDDSQEEDEELTIEKCKEILEVDEKEE